MNTEEIIELNRKAILSKEYSYSPYSKFRVGCALLSRNTINSEKIFTGCNIENCSYGATICAERTSVVKSISEGYRPYKYISISFDSELDLSKYLPCGICMQFLSEFCDNDFMIICLISDPYKYVMYKMKELLPKVFKL